MDWKKLGLHTCVYFTVITAIQLLGWMMMNSGVIMTSGYSPVRILCVLPFAALFAFANVFFKDSESKLSLRVLCHFLFTVGGAFVFLYLPSRQSGDSVEAAVAMALILAALYWIIMGSFLGLRARFHRIDRDSKHYKSLYRKDDKKAAVKKDDLAKAKENKKNKDDYQNVYKKN